MGFLSAFQNPLSAVMNAVDDLARLKGDLTGDANKWVAANSRDEPPQAQDYYPNRKHQNSSVIPSASSNIHASERSVYIACRVVAGGAAGGGLARAWNAETAGMNDAAPNPDHHWCVVVGDYLHQLQSTSLFGGDNYYTNEIYDQQTGGWKQFRISGTYYNDAAIRNAAVEVMNNMPETYNLLNNNCQTFALRLLDRILKDGRKVQLQGNRTYGLMKMPEMKLAPSTLVVTRRNEDGSETEVDADLKPIVPERHPIVVEEVKRPEVAVAELRVDADEEGEDVVGLNGQAKARFLPLLDALKIMDRETPVIELKKEE